MEGTWRAEKWIDIPTVDIVNFAFGRAEAYDQQKPIFVDASEPTRFVTAAVARRLVSRISTGLQHRGMRKGDCVTVHSFNCIWYPLLWLGIIAGGGCVAGSNPGYTASELKHHLSMTNTKFAIIQDTCSEGFLEAVAESQLPLGHVFVFDNTLIPADLARQQASGCQREIPPVSPSTLASLRDLLRDCEEETGTDSYPTPVCHSEIAVLAITSGTTGPPKAASVSHRFLVAQSRILEDQYEHRSHEASQLVCLPVFHAFAAQLALVLPLRLGITTYYMPRFRLHDYVQHVSTFSITDSAVVPPIISDLLRLDACEFSSLQSLRYMICAGATMSANVQSRLYSYLSPDLVVTQCWGASELGWVSLFNYRERDESGSVGRLLPNTELRLIDDDGKTITEPGVAGEGCVRSSSMLSAYRNNSQAYHGSMDGNGFYHTGDRISLQDGKVFIHGRIKETMKVNGWQVSTQEIETVLIQHSSVVDCAVAGVSRIDAAGVEITLPMAYVVLEPNAETNSADLTSFVAERLVSYKRLSGGVLFVNDIPRSSTGKILRHRLPLIDQVVPSELDTNQATSKVN